MKRKVLQGLICRPCCIQLCFWLWNETLHCAVSDAAGHRNVKLKKTVFDDCCCVCFLLLQKLLTTEMRNKNLSLETRGL